MKVDLNAAGLPVDLHVAQLVAGIGRNVAERVQRLAPGNLRLESQVAAKLVELELYRSPSNLSGWAYHHPDGWEGRDPGLYDGDAAGDTDQERDANVLKAVDEVNRDPRNAGWSGGASGYTPPAPVDTASAGSATVQPDGLVLSEGVKPSDVEIE